jgi:broad specificity phosphatase PhoE
MKLYLIRHGRTVLNTQNVVHKKDDDEALDGVGVKQAAQIARVCKDESIQIVYSSPEERAKQTAEVICHAINLVPRVLEDLGERNWGEWSGMQWEDIRSRLNTMSLDQRYSFTPPNGESWRQMDERLMQALSKIISDNNERAAVVSHGGSLRALMPILKGEPKESSFKYDFKSASLTIFEHTGGRWRELVENDTAFLSL